jgi:FAD/FMN-containing dehydrogenase
MSSPSPDRVTALARALRGKLLTPGDDGFAASSHVWNARFLRSPALVVRCAGDEDVAASVRFARDEGMELSVKGGGHDYAGNTVGEGSLLIDLSLMDGVQVDAGAGRAVVGPGARWGAVDGATTPHGLATPGGTVSTVGVSGLALGGGSGWLTRKHGLVVDNIRGVTVVTAEGEAVRADPSRNPDLFWAIRGGGGNFGVVTSFDFALHPIPPEILAGQIFHTADRAGELLRAYRAVFRDAPDELMCYPFLLRIPPVEPFPEKHHGVLALDFVVAWLGDPEKGEAHLNAFLRLGEPFLELVGRQSYASLQQAFDAGMGPGTRWYSRSLQLDELSDAAIEALVDGLDPFPGDFTVVYLGPGGGAAGRVAPDETAYPHRASAHELHIFPGWADPARDEEVMSWADRLFDAMAPHGNGGVYVNLLGDGEADRIREAYGPNLARLRELKRKWDPENLFRGNHNILPASGSDEGG